MDFTSGYLIIEGGNHYRDSIRLASPLEAEFPGADFIVLNGKGKLFRPEKICIN